MPITVLLMLLVFASVHTCHHMGVGCGRAQHTHRHGVSQPAAQGQQDAPQPTPTDAEDLPTLDNRCRVYASATQPGLVVLGDADGYLHAIGNDGQALWRHHIGSTISGMDMAPDGSVLWVIGTVQDISERKRAERHIEKLAFYDTLTALPNRTHFQDQLKRRLALARRKGHALALLFIDLDRFKEINDTYGHGAGDRAIQEIGHILSGALVANSVAIRMSGDEFMVLIRHGSEELLDEICTAIEQRVQRYNAAAPAGSFQLSFSTGVAKYEGGSVEKFLVELDQRMYAEKRAFHAARDGHAAPEQGNAPSI